MQTWRWLALSIGALALAAASAAAQDRLDAAAAALDRATAQPKTEATVVGRMAAMLKVAPDALRAQRTAARLGWGDFFVAQQIAVRGVHPVEKVFAARRTGTGWTEIAEEAGVSTDALVQDVATVWPDAARAAGAPAAPAAGAAAPAAPADEPKGLGAKMRELLGGGPATPSSEPGGSPPPGAQEDIRDKMIRGGGGRTR